MWKLLKKVWNIYRQVMAAKGLFELLGWWVWIAPTLGALCAAPSAYLYNATWPIKILLG